MGRGDKNKQNTSLNTAGTRHMSKRRHFCFCFVTSSERCEIRRLLVPGPRPPLHSTQARPVTAVLPLQARTPHGTGQTMRGLKFIMYIFLSSCGRSQNKKCSRMGLRIGFWGCFLVQPALFSEPGPFPRLPEPAVGPKGPKIGHNPGPDLSFYPR